MGKVITIYKDVAAQERARKSMDIGDTLALRAYNTARLASIPPEKRIKRFRGEAFRLRWASILFQIRQLKRHDHLAYRKFCMEFSKLEIRERWDRALASRTPKLDP